MREDPNDYAVRSMRANQAAAKAHREWIAGLPEHERRKAVLLGVDAPLSDTHQANAYESDPATWNDRGEAAAEIEDSIEAALCEDFGLSPRQAVAVAAWHQSRLEAEAARRKSLQLARVIGGFLKPGNLRVRAYSLAYAAGLSALNGIGSQTDGANICGCSRSNMSKETTAWTDLLDLPPSPHCKSRAARRRLSEAQRTNHWRNKKCTNLPSSSKPHRRNRRSGSRSPTA
jgi:hypothetical protein